MKVSPIHFPYGESGGCGVGLFQQENMSLIRASTGLGVFGLRDIEVLAEACICQYDAALAKVQAWLGAGVDLEDVYLDGLAAAARMMGEWWLSDRIDFVKVTIGVHSLQQILYELSPQFLQRANQKFNGYRAIFFSTPNSQHSFGSVMVAEFFRREGWRVSNVAPESESDVVKELSQQWFEVVGLSVCSDRGWPAMKSLITKTRQASLNPRVQIMIGGPMVDLNPDLAAMLGADLVGGDARVSQRLARQSIKRLELAT